MKSNWIKYVFVIFIILILVFAVFKIKKDEYRKKQEQSYEQNNQEIKTREIKLAIAQLDTINPILSKNKNVQDVTKLIFEPLVGLTSDYKAEPILAKEWAKQSDNSYLIKLRENVRWSNGQRFTAEDVRFTIDRLKDTASIYSVNVQNVTEVQIVDDYTIKIKLDKEIPFFEYNLTFPILSKTFYEGKEFTDMEVNKKTIGSGMFKISEIKDSYIILEKNTYWWNKEKDIKLDKININLYSSIGELYNAFKIGNIDLIATTNMNVHEYIGTIGYNQKEIKGRQHNYIALNFNNELIAKQEVRKALSYAIDKENIVSSVCNNNCFTSSFPLDYGNWLAKEQNASSGYNVEQVKPTLEKNGWIYRSGKWQKTENYKTKTLSLNMLVRDNDIGQVKVAENIREQLKIVGIYLNIVKVPEDQYRNKLANREYDMAMCSITLSPSPNLETFLGANNLSNYNNEEVNNILAEVRNTNDEKVLKSKYQRLIEIYKSDIPCISLYNNKYIVAYSNELVGEVTPNWFNQYYGIESWYK